MSLLLRVIPLSTSTQMTQFCIHLALLWTLLTNLQTSFNTIQHSFRGLQLLLNASKTKCMLFNRSLPAPARPTSVTTSLGVWLDCKLSFQTHIKHLQSKIKSRIGFLFRNKASFTHATKLTLVKLTILPILEFSDVIYKIASNTLLSKLDAVYHSAIPNHLIPPTTATCMLSSTGPRYIFVARPTGSRSSTSPC